jgi:hypothetical protein
VHALHVVEGTTAYPLNPLIDFHSTTCCPPEASRAARTGAASAHCPLASLGVYSGTLELPLEAFAAGLGDPKVETTLCLGGKERLRRLMEIVASGRADRRPLATHPFIIGHSFVVVASPTRVLGRS